MVQCEAAKVRLASIIKGETAIGPRTLFDKRPIKWLPVIATANYDGFTTLECKGRFTVSGY